MTRRGGPIKFAYSYVSENMQILAHNYSGFGEFLASSVHSQFWVFGFIIYVHNFKIFEEK